MTNFQETSMKRGRAVLFAQAALKNLQNDLRSAIEALPPDAHWEQSFRLRLMLKKADEAVADVNLALEH